MLISLPVWSCIRLKFLIQVFLSLILTSVHLHFFNFRQYAYILTSQPSILFCFLFAPVVTWNVLVWLIFIISQLASLFAQPSICYWVLILFPWTIFLSSLWQIFLPFKVLTLCLQQLRLFWHLIMLWHMMFVLLLYMLVFTIVITFMPYSQ